jgi:four helix bundle protein
MAAQTFQELEVWQKAHALVLPVYRLTRCFPRDELYGLTSQLRRAVVSVPANIAEGFVKRGRADKLRFYNIAQGSLEESRYFLILAHDLEYCDTTELLAQADEVSRMLEGYVSAVASNRNRFFSFFWLLASGSWLLSPGSWLLHH